MLMVLKYKIRILIIIILVSSFSLQPSGAVQNFQGSIVKISSCPVGGSYEVVIADNYAYIVNNDGMYVVDIHEISTPSQIGLFECGPSLSLDIKDDIAYLTNGNTLKLVNISNPALPILMNQIEESRPVNEVTINGDLAFTANHEYGLVIYNISNPYSPTKIIEFNPGGHGISTQIRDNICYYSNREHGLQLINVSDPYSPELLTTVLGTESAWLSQLYGSVAYLGCHELGIKIVDISDPLNAFVIKSYVPGGEVMGLSGNDEYLYIADCTDDGIELLNVTDPSNIEVINVYSGAGDVHKLYFDGEYAYLADFGTISTPGEGFTIIQYDPEAIEEGTTETYGFPLLGSILGFVIIAIVFSISTKKRNHEKIK